MGIWDRLFGGQKRSYENPNTNLGNPAAWLVDLFGGDTASGEKVNQDTALTFSAVYACIRVLSETIASLPIHVCYKDGDGSKFIDYEHGVHHLISNEPNSIMTSYSFRETLQTHLCLYGNAYAEIKRNGRGEPLSIKLLMPSDVDVYIKDEKLFYEVTEQNYNTGVENKKRIVQSKNMIHLTGLSTDGIMGKSPITIARENIGLGLAAQKFGGSFFGNGANVNGILTHPGTLNDVAQKRLKKSWNNSYTGASNGLKTAVLEEGMKYERIGIPPNDAQFIETRKFQVTEIARIFRVPPHMIADLERATFTNIEHQAIEFATHTVRPWLVKWEQELNRKLFGKDESNYYIRFNIAGLLRGDNKSRSDYYKSLFYIGAYSINDIRSFEDMNKVEDGDTHFVPTNMMPLEDMMVNFKQQQEEEQEEPIDTDDELISAEPDLEDVDLEEDIIDEDSNN